MRGLNHIIFSQLEWNAMKMRRESFCDYRLVSACTALNYKFTCFFVLFVNTLTRRKKMRLRRLINNEPLKISLHLKKHSYPDCHTLSICGLNIPPHACEGGNTRASSPSSRALRAFLCARHNSYAPITKERMRLDKNSYPSANQCFNHLR